MSRDDIIRMAREVHDGVVFMPEDLERFANLVAAAAKAEEREACAKVCEIVNETFAEYYTIGLPQICASKIRARGEKCATS